jgi:Secretion system C-terminal sorting domain
MNLRYSLALLVASAAASAVAQPSLSIATSVPGVGQVFVVNTANDFVGLGPVGTDVTFDHWNMLAPTTGTQNIEYLGTSATSTSTLIPSASLLSTDGGSDTLFWDVTAQGLEMVGSRTALEGVLDFNDPSLELKLPCSYGTTWSDATGDTYTVSGIPVTRVGTVTGNADSWGSLTMPWEVVFPEVLRVHLRRNISDNSAVLSTVRISNIYSYYAETLEHPIVKITIDSTQVSGGAWTVTKRQLTIGNPVGVGVNEVDANEMVFTAYPNPVVGAMTIDFTEPVATATRLQVLDLSGRVVLTDAVRGQSGQLDTSALPGGIYSLRVIAGERVLGVQRITVL